MIRKAAIISAALLQAGCFIGEEHEEPAPREMIIEAAARCGVPDFVPTPRGDGRFAAIVDDSIPDSDAKEACIIYEVEQRLIYRLER